MLTKTLSKTEYMGIPSGSSKNGSNFITVECLLEFDADENKLKYAPLYNIDFDF